jgi:hypothetical protein
MDAAIIALTASITALCAVQVYGGEGRSTLRIQGTDGSWVYPLDRTVRLELDGPLGTSIVELDGGAARFLASPCTGKICLRSGEIHRRGQWIACLPNGISLVIEGTENSGNKLDASAW